MTITYDINKDKDNIKILDNAMNMCRIIHSSTRTDSSTKSRKITDSKYLCPCGLVNKREDKIEEIGAGSIIIASEKCGI